MYNNIVFDVDGTILDTEMAVLKSLQRVVYEELNKEMPLEDLNFSFGITGVKALEILKISDIEGAFNKWIKYLNELIEEVKVFHNIKETLIKLNEKGISTGVVTSRTKEEYQVDFDYFKLFQYFNTIICADDTEKHKPNPEPLLKYLEVTGANNKDTLYVGDTLYDSQCAQGAEVNFALASWGAKTTEGFEITHILKDPMEILKLIE